MSKHLYILRPIEAWEPWYDKAFGFVVRAKNRDDARKMASEEAGDEGKDVWLNPTKTTCHLLKTTGKIGIVIKDFQAA